MPLVSPSFVDVSYMLLKFIKKNFLSLMNNPYPLSNLGWICAYRHRDNISSLLHPLHFMPARLNLHLIAIDVLSFLEPNFGFAMQQESTNNLQLYINNQYIIIIILFSATIHKRAILRNFQIRQCQTDLLPSALNWFIPYVL